MRTIKSILIFYEKIVIPAAVVSIVLGLFSIKLSVAPFFKGTGFAYMFIGPLFHYFVYETRNPNEYYFYYNLGLNKISLWLSSVLISILIGLILSTL
ncbi:MAG: hypothetical protein AB7S48_09785 [Bacteroidales bacterium]